MAEQQQELDFDSMSDEDFASLDDSAFEEEQAPEEEAELINEGDATDESGEEETESNSEEESDEEDDDTDDDDSTDDSDPSADSDDGDNDADDDKEGDEKEEGTEESEEDDSSDTAHKDFFDKITSPFKANGREMKVESADDAVRLMQMGANYNRKMAGLKPSLKIVKMLENNKLLDEGKLGFLIDLDKKKPEAIAKLLKDAEIDPMDFNPEDAGDYKTSDYTVDEAEIELDTVIDEIKDTDAYPKTLQIVGSQWDEASKQIVSNRPQLLKDINGHITSGVYEVISTAMEKERMLGRLTGLSDIEAYRQIGDSLEAQGGFNHLFEQGSQSKAPDAAKPPPKAKDPQKRRDKRRAASSPKAALTPSKAGDYDPLGLSDEDFEKEFDSKFL